MPKKAVDYSKAVIYQICCKDLSIKDVYVGSTTNLVKRRYTHKSDCHNEKARGYNLPVYRFIRDHGGWCNFEVIKVQDASVTCSEDLHKLERSCYERLGAVLNKNIPGNYVGKSKKDYDKDRYKVNKVEIREKHKQYQESNKDTIAENKKQYYQSNKTEISEKRNVTVHCECGSEVSKRNISTHCKTKKHLAYLESTK